jgi:chitosanase
MRLSLVLILAFVVFAVKADMTREQKRRCELFASIFENGKFELQYDYVENIHDNKGYTSGRIAFTTSMGDAFEVVRRYTVRVPNNPLARFVSDLKLLADRESHDVSQLTEYPKAWRLAARDPVFRMIQDEVADSLYYR